MAILIVMQIHAVVGMISMIMDQPVKNASINEFKSYCFKISNDDEPEDKNICWHCLFFCFVDLHLYFHAHVLSYLASQL